ncbi:MAG TPA: hypothetical protein VFV99_18050 [Kofleriaceae bacterium]|nr:hypothetical protein [Kofleriaceae bacterium]
MLRSVWLTCVLSVVSTTAWAQSAQPTTASAVATIPVAQAQQAAKSAEQKLVTLTNQRVDLRRRYDEQLSAIDRLKKQKASWRRDRELNKAQADANDTAKRLTAIDNQIKLAQQDVGKARNVMVGAIDAELATATGARADQLKKLRAQISPALPTPKKIVIPDAEIDPLSDPEELERQASALAAVEKQLEAQRKGLDQQHKDLTLVAELRSAHERAGELSTRDDDQPHRGAQKPTSRSAADEASPTAGAGNGDSAGGSTGGAGGGSGSGAQSGGTGGTTDQSIGGETFGGDKHTSSTFESNAAVALGEVIDKSTIEGMLRASRSGNPKDRAEAAKLARDAVAKQIDQLKKKRALIELRAKQLRKH